MFLWAEHLPITWGSTWRIRWTNILNLIRGDNGVEQAHLLSAVASVAVQDRDSVTVLTYIRLYHPFRLLRCHLKRYPLIPMIKLSMVFVEMN